MCPSIRTWPMWPYLWRIHWGKCLRGPCGRVWLPQVVHDWYGQHSTYVSCLLSLTSIFECSIMGTQGPCLLGRVPGYPRCECMTSLWWLHAKRASCSGYEECMSSRRGEAFRGRGGALLLQGEPYGVGHVADDVHITQRPSTLIAFIHEVSVQESMG